MATKSDRKFGLIGLSLFAGMALTLTAQTILPMEGAAIGAEKAHFSQLKNLSITELTTMALGELPEVDWIKVESGSLVNSETILFEGDNIISVWQGGPAKFVVEPWRYDEFILVLKGELILTDNEGNKTVHKTGDTFVLPKGFSGTWEMTEEYRELVLMDTTAYNARF